MQSDLQVKSDSVLFALKDSKKQQPEIEAEVFRAASEKKIASRAEDQAGQRDLLLAQVGCKTAQDVGREACCSRQV